MSRHQPPDPTRLPSRAAAASQPLPDPGAKRREIAMFLVLAVVIWPILSVAVVGGYGFLVWMSQLIMGPPGPPPV
ncbi:periplasmic nitrate reductase, NapE protein [Azospirillum brasilense]|uniref:Periplasmic nitrate reductase, NapE protein n=1 Tax=Azospirillum brasilense TaxID=192 RepID=A0A4D8QLW6_AZOBR|nr:MULTISPECIES: periplasmic nitrate reductase, NapE protein [Azospirillum]MDW7556115.1 periplasmic nitrate reductase, NapE protein [Azospirillum brasilense]MDW7596085.1 periplasmic nitrate reductase, NapE protein [Azospirillum brasilense]MDW7631037.1 periplasmic nitrate reductase, NapE protein [Azospirillum brasilense]MDX5955179.1 periplasmic nitrate reductase, NapE protein [Azospirillum brasilense]NUB14742.1 periplasmic nitrate reductase, NapE protein [Azospirillum brasilense]